MARVCEDYTVGNSEKLPVCDMCDLQAVKTQWLNKPDQAADRFPQTVIAGTKGKRFKGACDEEQVPA
ncbi:MAG: hypothetical protein ACM3JB_19205 [Acidobacteriaceae bacterium]